MLSEDVSPPSVSLSPELELQYDHTGMLRPALYYVNTSTGGFTVEVRDVYPQTGESDEFSVARALADAPQGENLRSPCAGMSVENVEVSGPVANVYLSYPGKVSDDRYFVAAAALANTLGDFFPITYVNLFINDQPMTMDGIPCGPVSQIPDLSNSFKEYTNKYSSQEIALNGYTTDVVLYFYDYVSGLLMSEVREIEFDGDDFASKLLSELSLGSRYNTTLKTSYNISDPGDVTGVYDIETSTYHITVASSLFIDDLEYEDAKRELGAFCNTLRSLVPYVDNLTITTDQHYFTLTSLDFLNILGDEIVLYFPDINNSGLYSVSRVVSQDDRGSLSTYVTHLIDGPRMSDGDDLIPPFEMDADNLLSVNIAGATAVCDFTEVFESMLSDMGENRRRFAVYALINSLCTVAPISSVLITINGDAPDLPGTNFSLDYPLMPNPGLISDT